MNHPEIRRGVAEILSIILGRSVGVQEIVNRSAETKWDSLKHIELILMTEERFNLSFTEEEMGAIDSTEHICRLIEQKYVS